MEFPRHVRLRARRLALCVLLAAPLAAAAQIDAGPYVPSPSVIVDEMLKLGAIRGDDYLIDLGSGDGRIPITAAQRYGARGFGVDIKPELVKLANENAARAGVGDKVRFEGMLHGLVALIIVAVTMLVAEEIVVRIYRRLGDQPAKVQPASP